MPPVRCALSNASTKALEKWITASGKKFTDYLFPGRGVEGPNPMGQRQLNRLLKLWVVEAELDPSDYSVKSLRRTKALHILKGTGDLQTVRALLETTTYCPRTPGRRTDLLSFPPAVPRDRADQATARIPRGRAGGHLAAGQLGRLHSGMDDARGCGSIRAD